MIQPNPKKKIVKKKTNNPYEGQKDAFGNPVYGEGTNRPFTAEERKKMPRVGSMGSGKNGKTIKKAKSGTSLGMKSVKSGYDKNPGVTRADFVAIGKGKAKSGTKMKKAMMGVSMAKPMMKSGGKMKKAQTGTVSKKFDRPDSKDTKPVFSTSGVGKNVPAKNGKTMKKCKYGCK